MASDMVRLGLRIPIDINKRLEDAAASQYISKNTLVIHIFEHWVKSDVLANQKSEIIHWK